jgi:hypothetical protein
VPPDSRVTAPTLAWAEIRALPRQSFATAALAVCTTLVAALAAIAIEGPEGMRDLLMFLWVVAELLVAVAVAARVASFRRTRFVESVFTTPVTPRAWFLAQALVGLALAVGVLLVQVPFILVYLAYLGPPPMLAAVFGAAVAVGLFAVCLGLFCGVAVGQAGAGAASGMAAGFGFLSFFTLILHGITAAGPVSDTGAVLLRITSLSPLALAADLFGIDIFGVVPREPWRAGLGLAALTAGLGAAAWFTYERLQGPLGWEPRRGRVLLVAILLVALAVPPAAASLSFDESEDDLDYVFDHGDHTRIAFVPRGTPIQDEQFEPFFNYDLQELQHGEDTPMDVLVMLTVPPESVVRSVSIAVTSDDLRIVEGGHRSSPDGAPDGRARLGEGSAGDGSQRALRPVFRVPVTFRAVEAKALLGSPAHVEVRTTFTLDGRSQRSDALMTLHSDIPGVSSVLLAAGAPIPIAAASAVVLRRHRTR